MKEYTKYRIKQYMKKLGKVSLKVIIVALAICIPVGAYIAYEKHNKDELEYKINTYKPYAEQTSKDISYNGIYTLTKLDENGNNTWNGLIMYVKNDKIIAGCLVEYHSMKELEEASGLKYREDDIVNNEINDDAIDNNIAFVHSIKWQEVDDKMYEPRPIGFSVSGAKKGQFLYKTDGIGQCLGEFLYYEKDVNLETDFDRLNNLGVLAAYDEKSKEIWLSKLLNNKNSVYSKDYKLIHYEDYLDVYYNCKIDNGDAIDNINDLYNAQLKDNYKYE